MRGQPGKQEGKLLEGRGQYGKVSVMASELNMCAPDMITEDNDKEPGLCRISPRQQPRCNPGQRAVRKAVTQLALPFA